MTYRALWLACTALTSLTISTTSHATNWTGANSTDWFTQGNWTFGVPNVAASAELVTMTPNPTVIAGNAAFAASTRISFGLPASLTITGPTASLTTTFGTAVGFIGTGSLTVANGARLTDQRDSIVGTFRGTANATISGTGSTWAVSNSLLVGTFDATGSLVVANGGIVTSATSRLGIVGAIGTATVTGAGSRWSTTGAWEATRTPAR
jgi:T5SS/PEP-CTERM-associated repeat protein